MSESGKILVISYAFPPMKVQMTPVVVKHIDMLTRLGYEVDVVCADTTKFPDLYTEDSLESFAASKTTNVFHLQPEVSLEDAWRSKLYLSRCCTDLLGVLHSAAFNFLMGIDLTKYKALMTFSPFNHVNRVMIDLKKYRPNIPWIAQFSDPWARNPLEVNILFKLWNAYFEPLAVKAADAIVHCSPYSLDLMLNGKLKKYQSKASVIPHFFVDELYPNRPKRKNELVTLRFLGTFFDNRNPHLFFKALDSMLSRRRDLRDQISIELIGKVPEEMINMSNFPSIPEDLVKVKGSVSYVESLELMYDADILLLIEAEVRNNVFFPSKLIDYLGANTRIVGMVSSGCSKDVCEMLNTWHKSPSDVDGLSYALEDAIDDVRLSTSFSGYEASVRNQFSAARAAELYGEILRKL